jgi:hypothetical protein
VFKAADETLALFISKVQQGYRSNSFHNFDHAFSVAHVAFLMFETVVDIKRHLTSVEMLRYDPIRSSHRRAARSHNRALLLCVHGLCLYMYALPAIADF